MRIDSFTRIVLSAIALLLALIAFRPLLDPAPARAQMQASDLYIEPGVHMLRSPDGMRQVLGKVVVDLRTGKIWGLPTGTNAPYPLATSSSALPTSAPFLLGKFDLEAMEK